MGCINYIIEMRNARPVIKFFNKNGLNKQILTSKSLMEENEEALPGEIITFIYYQGRGKQRRKYIKRLCTQIRLPLLTYTQ